MRKLFALLFLLQFGLAIGQNFHSVYARISGAGFYADQYGITSIGWEMRNDNIISFLPKAGLMYVNNTGSDYGHSWQHSFLGAEGGADLKLTTKYISCGMEMLAAYAVNLRPSSHYQQELFANVNFYIGTGKLAKRFAINFYTGIIASSAQEEAGPTIGFKFSYTFRKKDLN